VQLSDDVRTFLEEERADVHGFDGEE